MKIYHRCSPDGVEKSVENRVIHDISHSLGSIVTQGNQFVVNDSEWFIRRGSGKLTPCVMNAAKFLSNTFQGTLKDECHWEREKKLAGQTIDAFVELPSAARKFRIPPTARFLEFFHLWCNHFNPENIRNEFLACWHRFVQVGVNRRTDVFKVVRPYFERNETHDACVRIGLEFETGNIASSFRALDKLETLFVMGMIDYGVFITSIDKDRAAARIWPLSNRNGSFSELENRNYRHNRTVPLWEFGFEPDGFDQSAPYFNNTSLYEPVATGRTIKLKGHEYDVFRRDTEKLLRRVSPQ